VRACPIYRFNDFVFLVSDKSPRHFLPIGPTVESVRVLVELGANTNAQNNLTGATPLHMVAQSKKGKFEARIEVINILLSAGARSDIADKYGTLPVHSIQLSDDGDITQAELDEQTRRLVALLQPQRPKIFEAISDQNLLNLEQLISTDASVVNVVCQGQTPLSLVVSALLEVLTSSSNESFNDSEAMLLSMLKVLLNSSADPNCALFNARRDVSVDPMDPVLHSVVCTLRAFYKRTEPTDDVNHAISTLTEVIHCLFKAGATVPPNTILLLHQAARFNECRLASLLIDTLHIDPNTRGRQGMTPLQFAARSGQKEMIVSLSDAG
jgi:ankyrin repeat protein